jgi:hypothetical protein
MKRFFARIKFEIAFLVVAIFKEPIFPCSNFMISSLYDAEVVTDLALIFFKGITIMVMCCFYIFLNIPYRSSLMPQTYLFPFLAMSGFITIWLTLTYDILTFFSFPTNAENFYTHCGFYHVFYTSYIILWRSRFILVEGLCFLRQDARALISGWH